MLLDGGGRRVLFDNNHERGIDLDSIIAEREHQALSDEPFQFELNGGTGEAKVTSEVERWGKVSKAVNHVPPRSATALSTYEGALCTCVRYAGSGALVVEFEGETNTPTTPTNVPLWKQLHFQIVMEEEEGAGAKGGEEEVEEEKKSAALLPYLHAFSSSRKKRVLFKIPLFEATILTGSQVSQPGTVLRERVVRVLTVSPPDRKSVV